MRHEFRSADEANTETLLSGLVPKSVKLDRDSLLFEAGRRAASADGSVSTPSNKFWIGATVVLALVALGRTAELVRRPAVQTRMVYVDRSNIASTAFDDASKEVTSPANNAQSSKQLADSKRPIPSAAAGYREFAMRHGNASYAAMMQQVAVHGISAVWSDELFAQSQVETKPAKSSGDKRTLPSEPRPYRELIREMLGG